MITRRFMLGLCLLLSVSVSANDIQIKDAYINAPLPGQLAAAGYLGLFNVGDKERVLIKVNSPHAQRVEIHDHLHEGGVMRMRKLGQLPIGAGRDQQFKSHGLHLMLFGLQSDVTRVKLEFVFDNGERFMTQAEVRSLK